MKHNHWIILLIISATCFSCGPGPDETGSAEQPSVTDGGVVLQASVLESAGITFGSIDLQMLSHDISARGQILLLPDKRANVSVLMGGTVQSIHVTYGQKVRRGTVLAHYTHPAIIEVQQNYINSSLMLEVMQQEFNRQESLWKEKVKSDKEFQQAKMEFMQAKAEYSAARAKITMMNLDMESLDRGEISSTAPIVSPISGQVEDIFIALGQYVDVSDPLFLVIDRTSPVLQLKVFEKDIHLIEKGQRVTFSSPTSAEEEYEAEIFNVGSVVDQEARIIYVMAEISSPVTDLVPGMFLASTIHTREQYLNALPESAVVIENENTRFGFYTTDAAGSAEYHFYPFLLTTGFTEEGYVEVHPIEPLPKDARIVLTGVYYLKSELMKQLGD